MKRFEVRASGSGTIAALAAMAMLGTPVLMLGCDDGGPDEAMEEIEDEVDDAADEVEDEVDDYS